MPAGVAGTPTKPWNERATRAALSGKLTLWSHGRRNPGNTRALTDGCGDFLRASGCLGTQVKLGCSGAAPAISP